VADADTFETNDEYYTDNFKSPTTRIYVREILEITERDPPPKRRRPNQLPALSRAAPARISNNAKGEPIDSFGSGYLEYSASITDLKEVRQNFNKDIVL
jgi:hypothetical protein